MVNNKIDYKLDIDFSKIFGTWYKPLSTFLESKYMYDIMLFLHEGYKILPLIPKKQEVFNVFNQVDYKDVRVIIIGEEPYQDGTDIGIAYAQADSLIISDELKEIEKCIERTCFNGFKLYMDTTLNHWVKQGVLPIYSSLTGEMSIVGKHKYHWRDFIRNLIININENKPGTIFMLWGHDANYFKQYINTNVNHVLQASSIKECISNKRMWHTENFKDCNKIIEETNGKEYCINW